MLKVVARNLCFDSSKKEVPRNANLKIAGKRSSENQASVNARYFDLLDKYIRVLQISHEKDEAYLKANKEKMEADRQVDRIREEVSEIRSKVNIYDRNAYLIKKEVQHG